MRRKIAKTSVLLTTQADENAVICKGYPFDPNGALARRDTRLASNRRRIRDGISTNPGGEIFSLTGWVSLVGQAKENRMKYIIQYVLPYEHRVRVGIQAESEEDALAKAEDLFHEGVLCLDSRSVPLLYDDFEEQGDSGVALEFTVEATAGDWPEPDASVKEIRRQAAAFRAARLLVEAYRIGEERGGSIEWDELDQAYQAALQAFPELSATIAGVTGDGSSEEHVISASQIQAVLEAYSLRVADTKGRSFAEMAEDLIDEIDLARIERAAMDAGQDPQNRAKAVSEAIKTSLVEIGVLEF